MKTLKTKKIIKEIFEIYDFLTKNYFDTASIKSKILDLEALILKEKLSLGEEKSIFIEVKKILPALQNFYDMFETKLEEEFVDNFLNSRKNLKEYLLYNRFVELITNEKNLAKISEKDRVLFIGSGPFPITAILLNNFTKCSVDCFDKNKKFVDVSKRVIEKLSLFKKIKIYNTSGEGIIKKKYSVVIIALLAKPKDKILQNIWNEIIKDTRVICRTSDGAREVFYEKTMPSLLIKYSCADKIFARNDQTISSVLLIK